MATKIKCKCDRCEAPALTHAIIGLPISEALKVGRAYGIPYTVDHLNLCETHLIRVGTQYVHVTELELGKCDQHA